MFIKNLKYYLDTMRKKIKKWGDSFILLITPEELEAYSLKEGDFIEVKIKKVLMENDMEFKTADQLLKKKRGKNGKSNP